MHTADYEGKGHWTEKTLEQTCTRDWSILQEDFQIFIPGGQAAEPHAGLGRGPASLGAARGGAHGGLREADPDPDAGPGVAQADAQADAELAPGDETFIKHEQN